MADLDSRHKLFEAARGRADLTVQQLWLRYLALGGTFDVFDIEGFLQGLMPLPDGEQDVLAHGVNERLEELYREAQVPYLAAVPEVAGDDPLAFLQRFLPDSPDSRPTP